MGGCLPASRLTLSPEDFIRTRFALEPLSFRPDIALYRPSPRSGLAGFLAEQGRADDPPYWAYAWAGGAALALFLKDNPETVAGRTVLDFGAGSGVVGIAAARAGAAGVLAFEPDPLGEIALRLNAKANGVELVAGAAEALTEVVLAGDVFYDAEVAALSLSGLEAHAARGADVLIGDPFRRHLPLDRLRRLAEYEVPDMGGGMVRAGVFALHP